MKLFGLVRRILFKNLFYSYYHIIILVRSEYLTILASRLEYSTQTRQIDSARLLQNTVVILFYIFIDIKFIIIKLFEQIR